MLFQTCKEVRTFVFWFSAHLFKFLGTMQLMNLSSRLDAKSRFKKRKDYMPSTIAIFASMVKTRLST